MKRFVKSSLMFLSMLLLVTACSTQPVETQPTPTPEPPAPPVETPEPNQPIQYPYRAPLTGLGSQENLDSKRPIMVMINNAPPARPQTGLNQADMIYEVMAEGEMTRFLTIFQSQRPEVIGPVRSIRPYFIQLGLGFDAVLVHAGGSPEALATLARSDYNLNELSNGRYFWRESFRKMPHNLYTKPELLEQAMQDKGMRTTAEVPHFSFLPEDAVITEGEPATQVDITFHSLNKAAFTYDAEQKKYMRFTAGKPHVDLSDNKQLAATNLLVISTKHRVLDKEGRLQVDVVGPGDGYLFQQGKVRKIKWKRSNGVIRAYEDATLTKEVQWLPGNTWVEILPSSPGLSQSLKFQ
ncbi:putative lipoprotein YerB [Brevibacillus reuszeri]|uniref:DUF3048 domain-containing protein n=1 Tax=Brevibacillus reuszeri TaxID=54915 RepID=UPI001B27645B|nr:DUF3048 domain-containing protein [Brevibacillus reuszeri]GIO07949.1 putative lipoprotein YerB [Brevibacillus reuszeri]